MELVWVPVYRFTSPIFWMNFQRSDGRGVYCHTNFTDDSIYCRHCGVRRVPSSAPCNFSFGSWRNEAVRQRKSCFAKTLFWLSCSSSTKRLHKYFFHHFVNQVLVESFVFACFFKSWSHHQNPWHDFWPLSWRHHWIGMTSPQPCLQCCSSQEKMIKSE